MRGKLGKLYDDDGCYITSAQLQFFLNSKKGNEKYRKLDDEFLEYYGKCRAYNLISDMMEKDPTCAKFYWDEDLADGVFSFPAKGKVAKRVGKLKLL